MTARRPAIVRFAEKVNLDGPIPEHRPDLGPCHLWTAATDGNGYGVFGPGGYTEAGNPKVVKAYAWAWEQEHGPVPCGLELDHLCRVTLCVRTSHLEAVTHAENMARGLQAIQEMQRAKTHCPDGHAYAEHGYFDPTVGGRRCRPCKQRTAREATRRYRARRALEASA